MSAKGDAMPDGNTGDELGIETSGGTTVGKVAGDHNVVGSDNIAVFGDNNTIIAGRERGKPAVRTAHVLDVRGVSFKSIDSDDPELIGEWLVAWIMNFFQEAQIVIDAGLEKDVKAGDYFVVVKTQAEIKNLSGELIGKLEQEGSLAKAVDVREKFTICQLENYPYAKYFKLLGETLEQLTDENGTVELDEVLLEISPVVKGQQVIAIPPEESEARDAIEEMYSRTLDEHIDDDERRFAYKEMIRKADAFLGRFAQGYFAPDAMFQRGFAQFKLEDYAGSIDTYDRFLKAYPFHVSAEGARDWTAKASKILQERKAPGPPPPPADAAVRKPQFDI